MKLCYAQWFAMLQLVMIGSGVFGTDIDFTTVRPYDYKLDEDSFRFLFEQGYSPLEAFLIDLQEGGE